MSNNNSLLANFNKATADIKKKADKTQLKICSTCKKASDNWVAVERYERGKLLEKYVKCGKCKDKELRRSSRKKNVE